ncbi:MAG TPA: metal-dependent hydrolase [Flavobacteriales bacterium]|nr:metal-dependent hydrolase [Flavobacteriales bacterium]|tara:strand:- start:116856 stop:117620 length:765 start_codon:yes stop_codon:yes gene_type:complete
MIAEIHISDTKVRVDFSKPMPIATVIESSPANVLAWYVEPPKIEPVRTEHFVGSVKEGGSVNFRNIYFNPHGHGTHTECVGHISKEDYFLEDCLKAYFHFVKVISVKPRDINDDKVILAADVKTAWNTIDDKNIKPSAIAIRTLPNDETKCHRHYSGTNPPYLNKEVVPFILAQGVNHLLIDTPSVDREEDGGELICHHLFWEYPENTQKHRTITELIYIDNSIPDGLYLLSLQPASFKNDAAPCKPVLYSVIN